MIVDGLLFKLIDNDTDEPDTVLCIPTSRVHVLLDFYHSSIMEAMQSLLNAINYQSALILSKFGRASKSIYNRMPHLSVVQERQEFSETFQKEK